MIYEPAALLSYCFHCKHISPTQGEMCPCGETGTKIALLRLLSGDVKLIVVESFKVRPKAEPSFYRPQKVS